MNNDIQQYFEYVVSNVILENLFRAAPYFLDNCPSHKLGDFLLYQYCVHGLEKKLLPINIQNKKAIKNSLIKTLENYITKHIPQDEKA
jgi:hypothetical protein